MNSFLKGLVLGSLAGAGYALLNTPRPGRENRELVKHYLKDVSASMKTMQASLIDTEKAVSDLANQGMKTAQVFKVDMQKAMDDFQHETAPHYNRMQEKLAAMDEHLNDAKVRIARQEKD